MLYTIYKVVALGHSAKSVWPEFFGLPRKWKKKYKLVLVISNLWIDIILALKSNKFLNVKKKDIAKNVNVKVKFHETYLTAKVCKTLALVKILENW